MATAIADVLDVAVLAPPVEVEPSAQETGSIAVSFFAGEVRPRLAADARKVPIPG